MLDPIAALKPCDVDERQTLVQTRVMTILIVAFANQEYTDCALDSCILRDVLGIHEMYRVFHSADGVFVSQEEGEEFLSFEVSEVSFRQRRAVFEGVTQARHRLAQVTKGGLV